MIAGPHVCIHDYIAHDICHGSEPCRIESLLHLGTEYLHGVDSMQVDGGLPFPSPTPAGESSHR